MPLTLKAEQVQDLQLIIERPPEDVAEICEMSFDFLVNGKDSEQILQKSKKYGTDTTRRIVEAILKVMIDATKQNASESDISSLQVFKPDALKVLSEFLNTKRHFIESSIKSANLRAYRIVNIEWRLETKFASRCILKQSNVSVVMKFFLHTEPKNENRDLLIEGENNIVHPDERQNRKDIILQTDITSLLHMIHTLEDALIESRTRRIRNIVGAIH